MLGPSTAVRGAASWRPAWCVTWVCHPSRSPRRRLVGACCPGGSPAPPCTGPDLGCCRAGRGQLMVPRSGQTARCSAPSGTALVITKPTRGGDHTPHGVQLQRKYNCVSSGSVSLVSVLNPSKHREEREGASFLEPVLADSWRGSVPMHGVFQLALRSVERLVRDRPAAAAQGGARGPTPRSEQRQAEAPSRPDLGLPATSSCGTLSRSSPLCLGVPSVEECQGHGDS